MPKGVIVNPPVTKEDLLRLWHDVKSTIGDCCHSIDYAGDFKRDQVSDKLIVIAVPKYGDTKLITRLRDAVNQKWGRVRSPFPGGILTEVRGLKKIDFHWAVKETFGWRLFYLTGSMDFVQRACRHATSLGMTVTPDRLSKNFDTVPTPNEATVFEILECKKFVEPKYRI